MICVLVPLSNVDIGNFVAADFNLWLWEKGLLIIWFGIYAPDPNIIAVVLVKVIPFFSTRNFHQMVYSVVVLLSLVHFPFCLCFKISFMRLHILRLD